MSQMPDSIYLHKDSKYNTSGEYFAQDENRILYENEYDESVMEDYVEYTPIYRLEEAVRKVEKDLGWHSVEESLPEIDEEVIALTNQMHGKELDTARVICFAHRPDPSGWDGRSLSTGKVEHFDVETYDGWNIPGVKFWMPMPKIPEEVLP